MFQHERQPLKPTSGLLSPSSMRADPMAWQWRSAGEENKATLCCAQLGEHQSTSSAQKIPVVMCMRPSFGCHCTTLAEGLQIPTELQMVFTFFVFFVGTLCLQGCTEVRFAFCLHLCHYEIINCWECQSGLEKLVWFLLLSSAYLKYLCLWHLQFQPGGFRWTELSRFVGNCLVVVGFCFFLLFKFMYLDLLQLGGNSNFCQRGQSTGLIRDLQKLIQPHA